MLLGLDKFNKMKHSKIKIVAVGDIMPGGILHGSDRSFVSNDVINILKEGDVRVGTLECAIGNEPTFCSEKLERYGDLIYAKDDDLCRLSELNINVVSLANNHFFDLGVEGAEHTITMLDSIGILHCGAGMNSVEAAAPAVVDIMGRKIAFFGFCDTHSYMGWVPFANNDEPGVNPLEETRVIDTINKAKKNYDYVVIIPHWGREHTYNVTDWVESLSRKMLNAGADLILGSHPHRVQPVSNIKQKSVAYSMGNFLFPERLIAPPLRSTYYPGVGEKIDYTQLPTTDRYPAVTEITYKKWRHLAQIGMIVTSVISKNRVKSTFVLTCLKNGCYVKVNNSDYSIKNTLWLLNLMNCCVPIRFLSRVKRKFVSWFVKDNDN